MKKWHLLLLMLFLVSCSRENGDKQKATVRVAAIQCPSEMGKTAENLKKITILTRNAAEQGAKIIVFPECALQGYMDPLSWTSWSKSESEEYRVKDVAETISGPSLKVLSELARELRVYLCVGFIELAGGEYFNSQVLFNKEGKIAAHHQKKSLWTPGDSSWCSIGERPVQVIDSEYGRLGLMICYDFHDLPPLLAEKDVDIVLYSVGWYGPNEKNWFSNVFPAKAVIPYDFDIVVSNWTSMFPDQDWPGRGHSCVITGRGDVLAMTDSVYGSEIVLADILIRLD